MSRPQTSTEIELGRFENEPKTNEIKQFEKELVVASLRGDDTSWLDDFFPDWIKSVYVANDNTAPLTVPVNKGREAMAYLTYIIDRYEDLPDVVIFIHSLRYQWHNEDPMYDGVPVLLNLQLNHVKKRGYVALRCSWTMGCPSELHPLKLSSDTDDRSKSEAAYAAVFKTLFPNSTVPEVVGAHCSSQFAVSRERVRETSKAEYEHIRKWLLETDLEDQISGRVLEYTWHIIMQMPAVDCQDAGQCFCETFGLCNLTCTESGCDKRYKLPSYSVIPQGWPEVGPGSEGWPERGWAD
ncbi:uncharacterized protein BDZ99DRAFT_461206 [Mytilinidion resinicola]|uniref:Uncharacterized protein n=1 Tax=Mytilinidion resinicola TaxID=574789 RepID=A0A6A6YX06_9PEZI|nr:uncharacterized protein BDZ99DRAFT_461206 [Mytilinidion resinicola]KAF2812534.1 hypothetical protein BDZ99DRAFT_461206 [Mytilinidion resinicola]